MGLIIEAADGSVWEYRPPKTSVIQYGERVHRVLVHPLLPEKGKPHGRD